jgi:hypothetical protein
VRDVKAIAAGGATDSILDCAVVVSFLLYYGILVYNFVVGPTILRYVGVGNRDDGAVENKSCDFLSFGLFPS